MGEEKRKRGKEEKRKRGKEEERYDKKEWLLERVMDSVSKRKKFSKWICMKRKVRKIMLKDDSSM